MTSSLAFVLNVPEMYDIIGSMPRVFFHSLSSCSKELNSLLRGWFPYTMKQIAEYDLKQKNCSSELYPARELRPYLMQRVRDTFDVNLFKNLCGATYYSLSPTEIRDLVYSCMISFPNSPLRSILYPFYSHNVGTYVWELFLNDVILDCGSYSDIKTITTENNMSYAQYVAIRFPEKLRRYIDRFGELKERRNPNFEKLVSLESLACYYTVKGTINNNLIYQLIVNAIENNNSEIFYYLIPKLKEKHTFTTVDIQSSDMLCVSLMEDLDIRKSLITTKDIDTLKLAKTLVVTKRIPALNENWEDRKPIRSGFSESDRKYIRERTIIWKRDYRKNIQQIVQRNYSIENIVEQCEFFGVILGNLTLSDIYKLESYCLMKYHVESLSSKRLRGEIEQLKRKRNIISCPWNVREKVVPFTPQFKDYDTEHNQNLRSMYKYMAEKLGVFSVSITNYDPDCRMLWMKYTRKSTFEMIQYTNTFYRGRIEIYAYNELLLWLIENPIHCKESEKDVLKSIHESITSKWYSVYDATVGINFTLH